MAEVIDGEFTAFVTERGDALLRVAYALSGNQHAAEDLLQNELAKAYARWPKIRGDAEPYVKRILYHDQVSGWRRRARRTELPVAELPERPAAGGGGHDADLRLLLRDALQTLRSAGAAGCGGGAGPRRRAPPWSRSSPSPCRSCCFARSRRRRPPRRAPPRRRPRRPRSGPRPARTGRRSRWSCPATGW